MKLHRHVALIEVSDPAIIDALQATEGWDQQHLRRISPTTVAILMEQVETVAAKLRGLGYLPRVIER